MAFTFNAQDPRYQREQQKLAAKSGMRGGTPAFGAREQLATKHALSQGQTRMQFDRLGLESKLADQRFEMAKARFKMANKERGLQKDRLSFEKKLFGREMDDRKSNLRWTIGLGLGTAGYSYLEGRKRASMLEAERLEREKFREQYQKDSEDDRAFRRAMISQLGLEEIK